ncbi:hypothetical protein [Tahibacter amnicola]|uniref:Outer membrane repeat protein n=1 Tax=Tahibacter amnicola TaxID=2976241 RepID=A0ABY6BAC9_9GAMM|nr:hypothetical protein [Tahibacter amnicola]UXI67009.1 hypothetical protein N4264_19980 [Tahibacter amnicola]
MFRHLPLAVAAVSAAAPVSAAIYSVGPSGTPGSCTHTTIQAAVNAAAANPGPDEIFVSTNGVNGYANQAITIVNQPLTLIGGFSDCFPLAPTGMTRLNGSGGAAAPVIFIQSTGDNTVDVQLERFEILNGDNTTGFTYGGGISIQARGQVSATHLRVAGNRAYYGAGIAVVGDLGEQATRLTIGDHVLVEDNLTAGTNGGGSGGGIYVNSAALRLGGVNTVVRRNSASSGGGVAIGGNSPTQRSSLVLQSGGEGADRVIANNTASYAGGGLLVGAYSTATLFTTDPARPVSISGNSADYGGGIWAYGPETQVTMWEGRLHDNTARQAGGGITADRGAEVAFYPLSAGNAPQGAVACTASAYCNRLTDNRAGDSFAWLGAVALMKNSEATVETKLILHSTVIAGNVGYTLFADGCDAPPTPCGLPSSIRITNSLIAPNFDAESLLGVYQGGTLFRCDLCTIASNGVNGDDPFIESSSRVELSRSILWQPGRDIIGGSFTPQVQAQSLLLHDASDFAGQSHVRVGDPHFIAQGAGDFRLAITSPALDSASAAAAPAFDLDGHLRNVDQPGLTNQQGPLDLGAFERHNDTDLIFRNSFE